MSSFVCDVCMDLWFGIQRFGVEVANLWFRSLMPSAAPMRPYGVCIYVYMYVCMYVYMYVYVCSMYMYVCMYVYIYIYIYSIHILCSTKQAGLYTNAAQCSSWVWINRATSGRTRLVCIYIYHTYVLHSFMYITSWTRLD